jgi:hypothetical protein
MKEVKPHFSSKFIYELRGGVAIGMPKKNYLCKYFYLPLLLTTALTTYYCIDYLLAAFTYLLCK